MIPLLEAVMQLISDEVEELEGRVYDGSHPWMTGAARWLLSRLTGNTRQFWEWTPDLSEPL